MNILAISLKEKEAWEIFGEGNGSFLILGLKESMGKIIDVLKKEIIIEDILDMRI